VLFVVYKLFRIAYVSLWFYTAPFVAIALQFWLIDAQLEVGNHRAEDAMRE